MRMSLCNFFPSKRAGLLAGFAVAALLAGAPALVAQDTNAAAATQQPTPAAASPIDQTSQAQATQVPAQATATLSNQKPKKKAKVDKADRVQQTKDTKAAEKRDKKIDPLVAKDEQLPDKQLYDKALAQQKSGHFDVARLDLQTLLNTYPDSQYQMRAKLAVADSWYQEGGTAALAQAEQEYTDFITFFPNAPEAAEAQMRIGDIYFKQLDVPDRDYSKAEKAEDAYRTMLKQYPDAPKEITAQAQQKLRETQELLAAREAEIAAYYAGHSNWPASIARYQTLIDTYPQYSHMDDALIGLGDDYEAESAIVRLQKLPEAARVKLLEDFDGKAAAAYRQVVLYHSAAPHVEDAKERLAAMDLPIPVPTKEEVAASEALEGSRAQYDLRKRLELLVLRKPDTVTAAQIGDPPLQDAAPTFAPAIVKGLQGDYLAALYPKPPGPNPARPAVAPEPAADTNATSAPAAPERPASTAPPTLSDVPTAGEGAVDNTTNTVTEAAPAVSGTTVGGANASLGVEVLTPGAAATNNVAPPSTLPAATGAQDPNYGLPSVHPKDATALPPVEKPAAAPDQINEVEGKPQPVIPQADNSKSKKKKKKGPAVDKSDESSSKSKPKKGLDKLNPF
jgi:outer membrane protein assembly factor BamD